MTENMSVRVDEDTSAMVAHHADVWLTVRQAAVYAGLCEKTIRRAYLTRQLQHTRAGSAVRMRRSWVDDWLERATVSAIA